MIRDAWYVAAWSKEVRAKPLARTVLGRRIMLLRTDRGAITALGAQCPHRHGDLSRGELSGGRIRCPYHGWSFDMSGRCVEIPGTSRIPKAACVPSYAVAEQQGMVWVWLGDPDKRDKAPPHFDFSPSPEMRRQRTPARLWDVSYVDLVENTLDPTHITATHARTLGSRWAENVGVMSKVELLPDDQGFIGRAGRDAEPTGFASRRRFGLAQILTPPIPLNAVYRFEFGGAVHALYGYGGGHFDYAFAAITPCDEHRSWFFAEVGRWHRLSLIGDIMQFAAMRVLQREDYGVVRRLIHDDVRPPGSYVGIANDRMMNTFRALYHRKLRAESRAEAVPPDSTETRIEDA